MDKRCLGERRRTVQGKLLCKPVNCILLNTSTLRFESRKRDFFLNPIPLYSHGSFLRGPLNSIASARPQHLLLSLWK